MARYASRSSRATDALATAAAVGCIGVLAILFIVLIFGLSLGVFTLLTWAGNYGLHVAFGVAMLGFKKTVAVGVVLAVLRSLFGSSK